MTDSTEIKVFQANCIDHDGETFMPVGRISFASGPETVTVSPLTAEIEKLRVEIKCKDATIQRMKIDNVNLRRNVMDLESILQRIKSEERT